MLQGQAVFYFYAANDVGIYVLYYGGGVDAGLAAYVFAGEFKPALPIGTAIGFDNNLAGIGSGGGLGVEFAAYLLYGDKVVGLAFYVVGFLFFYVQFYHGFDGLFVGCGVGVFLDDVAHFAKGLLYGFGGGGALQFKRAGADEEVVEVVGGYAHGWGFYGLKNPAGGVPAGGGGLLYSTKPPDT